MITMGLLLHDVPASLSIDSSCTHCYSRIDVTYACILTQVHAQMQDIRVYLSADSHNPHNIQYLCRTHPILLELALASGLSQPPSKLLRSSDPGDFSPECLQWLRQFRSVPLTLKQASRCCIRRSLGNTILHSAPLLPLPSLMVDFVIFASAEIDDL